jgi:hypothetical protein
MWCVMCARQSAVAGSRTIDHSPRSVHIGSDCPRHITHHTVTQSKQFPSVTLCERDSWDRTGIYKESLSIKVIMFVSNCIKCTCKLIKWYLQLAKFESATCSSCKLHACTRATCYLLLAFCVLTLHDTPTVNVRRPAVIATHTFHSSVNAKNIYGSRLGHVYYW